MYRALHRNPPRFGRSKEELSVTLAATKIQAFFRYCRDKKSAEEYYQTVFEKVCLLQKIFCNLLSEKIAVVSRADLGRRVSKTIFL